MADNAEKKSESSEDSIAYLRAHGVEVETPEDRKNAAAKKATAASLREGDAGTVSFKYVCVPADESKPLTEHTATAHDGPRGLGDQLPPLLASAFSGGGMVNMDALRNAMPKAMAGGLGDKDTTLTPEAVAAQGGATESFRLSDEVFLYLDEVGSLKRLPINKRATRFAALAGYGDGVMFCGDVYLGRVAADTNRNADFTLKDTDGSAEWIHAAAVQNLQRQKDQGGVPGGISAEELTTKGGDGDGYNWTQNVEDVEVNVPVPAGTRGKDIKVNYATTKVTIDVKDGKSIPLALFAKVAPDGCSWSLSDGVVTLTLEKMNEGETWPVLTAS